MKISKTEYVEILEEKKSEYINYKLFNIALTSSITGISLGISKLVPIGVNWIAENVIEGANVVTVLSGAASAGFGASGLYKIYEKDYESANDHLFKSAFLGGLSVASLYSSSFIDKISSSLPSFNIGEVLPDINMPSSITDLKNLPITSIGFGLASLYHGVDSVYQAYQGDFEAAKDDALKSVYFGLSSVASIYSPSLTLFVLPISRSLYGLYKDVEKLDNYIEDINMIGQEYFIINEL